MTMVSSINLRVRIGLIVFAIAVILLVLYASWMRWLGGHASESSGREAIGYSEKSKELKGSGSLPTDAAFSQTDSGSDAITDKILSTLESTSDIQDIVDNSESTPRAKVRDRLSSLTMKETIADLGNIFVVEYCATNGNIYAPDEIEYWSKYLLGHMGVMRLVEEGRNDPQSVQSELHNVIREHLARFPDLQVDVMKLTNALVSGEKIEGLSEVPVYENSPHYSRTFRYENTYAEHDRSRFLIMGAFYVLLNIDGLEQPEYLAEWIDLNLTNVESTTIEQKQLPSIPRRLDVHVWLISSYWNQPSKRNTRQASEFRLMLNGSGIDLPQPRSIEATKWNSSWSLTDPLLAATGADTRSIDRITILDIPKPFVNNKSAALNIISHFREYAASNRKN